MPEELMAAGQNSKSDPFSNICRFMTDGDVVLSAKEDQLLSRWVFADTLMRGRKHTEDAMIDQMKVRFGISRHTAQNDLFKAQALFEKARSYSKRYLAWNHLQEIGLAIERAKNDKSLAAVLPKLYDSYTKALKELPQEVTQDLPPTAVVKIYPAGGDAGGAMSFEQARARAGEKLAEKKPDTDYTEYEEVG